MINWHEKLTSRKFWVSISGIITAIIMIFNEELAMKTEGTLLMILDIIAYIMGEAWIDTERRKADAQESNEQEEG